MGEAMPWYRTLRTWGFALILLSLLLDVVALAMPIGSSSSVDWEYVSSKAWAGYGAFLSWISGIILVAAAAIVDAICDSARDAVRANPGVDPAPAAAERAPMAIAPPVVEEPEDPEEAARRARSNEIAIVLFLAFLVVLGSFLVFAVPRGRTKPPEPPAATNSVGDTAVPGPTDAMVANLSDAPGAE